MPRWTALLASLFIAAGQPAAAAEHEASITLARRGEAFVVDATLSFPVTLKTAWDVLTDYDRMAAILGNLSSSQVVSRDGNTWLVRQKGVARYGPFSYAFFSEREVRLEPMKRIVSRGQATMPGEWYDQGWDEWVLLLSGSAALLIDGDPEVRTLMPGDYLMLPAHCRHRVAEVGAQTDAGANRRAPAHDLRRRRRLRGAEESPPSSASDASASRASLAASTAEGSCCTSRQNATSSACESDAANRSSRKSAI